MEGYLALIKEQKEEIVFNEIMDNLGNYIDIVLEKIEENEVD